MRRRPGIELLAVVAALGPFAASPLLAQTSLAAPSTAAGAPSTPLLVAPAERGVVLRWVWGEGARPAGYFVERRPSRGGPWSRLTPQPVTRARDRAIARARLGDQFDRYVGLLFPADPRAEQTDPESYRGMLLLSADLEPGVAHLLGLRYDDSTATNGTSYEYRLFALTAAGEVLTATSDAVVAGGLRPAAAPNPLTALTSSRGAALRWAPSARFSGYRVYRSTRRDGADARRLSDAPVILFTREAGPGIEASATFFTDTAPPARDTAYYWVEGIDAFGRASQRSAPAPFARRSIATFGAPVLVQTRVEGDTVVVTWQAPTDSGVTNYQVWRSQSDTGPFLRLGAPVRAPAREQRDPGRPARRISWYRVTALDASGRESDPSTLALAEVPDLTPPLAPDSIVGVADSGRVTLGWRAVVAPDLRGYRMYRATTAEGAFGLLSVEPQRAALLVDTIPLRADHAFYYRVTAVDSSFNESAPSAVIAVRPPDRTPPSPPRIGQVRSFDRALRISWLPNPEPDVVAYGLRYRLKGDAAWRDAGTARPRTQLSDTIPALLPGRVYEVTVVAVDDAGNVSAPAPSVEARLVKRSAPVRPDLRRVAFEASERGVVITVSAAADDMAELMVLRREAGQSYRPVGVIGAATVRFVDRTVRAGRTYEYIVRARDAFGNASESGSRRVDVPAGGS